MNNNIRGYNPLYRVILAAAATLVFAGIFIFTFLINYSTALASATINVVDEVLAGSLPQWTVGDSGGNPIFTYQEITSPYDDSTAIRTSVVGNTVALCPSQYLSRTYDWGGNTSNTNLQAYLAFSSTMDEYNFPYVTVQLFDAEDNQLGYQVYYGKGVISGHYAGIASGDPSHFTELSAAEGDMVMDLSRMGSDIDFHHFSLTLSNYACIGENSVTFDQLRIINGSGETANTAPVATPSSFTVEAGQSHAGAVAGTDADTDPLTFEPLIAPMHGSRNFNPDGSFTYLADANYAGDDSFTFRAYDGKDYSAPATVTITVTAPEPEKVIKLLVYNPNVLGPNDEECKGQYGALPYEYLEANGVEVTFWCNDTVVDASVLADYDVLYVGRARASYYGATYINSTDLKNWVSSGGGAILESTGDSFEPGTTDIIWPDIHDLFGYNNCPAISTSDSSGGGPLTKLIEHPIWDGVAGAVGDSGGLYDDELNDSCIGTGIKIGNSGSFKQNPLVNEFGGGRTYSGVLVDYTLNDNSQRYFLNVVDWVAQGGKERDTTAPVITLLGDAVVRVNVGETYVDAGATAQDNVDGAVAVETTGIVDTNTLGTYQITYTAEDSSGNVATENRTVRVVEPDRGGGSGGNATRVGDRRINKAPDPQALVLGAQTSTQLELLRQIRLQLIKILTLYIQLLKQNQS
jgi:Domain of unknown function (DUF5011)/Bacterial Ig domain